MAAVERSSLWRHLPASLAATAAVTGLPLVGIQQFERVTGNGSLPLSLLLGALISLAVSNLGTRIWSSFVASDDIVFGELMLWGWIRRFRSEGRLARATQVLGIHGKGWSPDSDLTPEEQRSILQDLAVSLETRDAYTYGHTNRVTRYSYAIAKRMGLAKEMIETIRVAATLHDVGKIDVPSSVLRKPGSLTDEEFEIMKRHSARGAEMVEKLGNPVITGMVRHHHERLDGRGYPDRLSGTDIPLGARIIAVADTFDAICSTRSYRNASNHKKALTILKKEAGTQLDEEVVDAFVTYYSGHSTLEWRVSVTTIPQRILGAIGRSAQVGTGAGVVQSAAAVATAISIFHAPASFNGNRAGSVQQALASRMSTSVEAEQEGVGALDLPFLGGSKSQSRRLDGSGSFGAGEVLDFLTVDGDVPLGDGDAGPGGSDPSTTGDGGPSGSPSSGGGGSSGFDPGSAATSTTAPPTDDGITTGGTLAPTDSGTGTGGKDDDGGGGSGGGGGSDPGPGGGVTDDVDDTAGGTTDTVDDTVDNVTDTVGGITGGGGGSGGGGGGTGGGTGGTVGETVGDTTGTTKDTVDTTTDTVNTTTDTVNNTTDTVGNVVGPPPIGPGLARR